MEPVTGPIHLNPATELAPRVLLPGDPHRALLVAQELLEKPLMFNHRRGLWGYTGTAADGELLTIQASGMGGPSAAIVTEELIGLGAEVIVRIGTCGAIVEGLELGRLLPVREAIAADGTSTALGAAESVPADEPLTEALAGANGEAVTVASTDVFYDDRAAPMADWRSRGAVAVEMEAAAVLHVARLRGARAACLLAVSDLIVDGRRRLDDDGLEAAGRRLGEAAFAALAAGSVRDG